MKGSLVMTNYHALVIELTDYESLYVHVEDFIDGICSLREECPIEYDSSNEEHYFLYSNDRYYLSEFIRI